MEWLSMLLLILFIIILAIIIDRYQPTIIRKWIAAKYPRVNFYRAKEERNVVAVTIDDAVTPYTAQLLQLLQEAEFAHHQVTFFTIGQQVNNQNRYLLHRMNEQGHEIGNHDYYNRSSLCAWLGLSIFSRLNLHEGIMCTARAIGEQKWFRPGGGLLTRNMAIFLQRMGYRIALADVYSRDCLIPFPSYHAHYASRHVRKGSTLVYHDGRSWSVSTLRAVLTSLNNLQLRSVSLSQLYEADK